MSSNRGERPCLIPACAGFCARMWADAYDLQHNGSVVIPTLARLAQGTSWVWARCPIRECLHDAAIPLKPAIAHFGGDVSSDRLRAGIVHCKKRAGFPAHE